MSAVGLRDDIGGECADGVNGDLVGRQWGEAGHRSQRFLEDDGMGDGRNCCYLAGLPTSL